MPKNRIVKAPTNGLTAKSIWKPELISGWQAFSFSQAYIFHIQVGFFRSNLDSQHTAGNTG